MSLADKKKELRKMYRDGLPEGASVSEEEVTSLIVQELVKLCTPDGVGQIYHSRLRRAILRLNYLQGRLDGIKQGGNDAQSLH